MRRRYFRESGPVRKQRVNHEIRLTPIRLIDHENNQVGVIETRDALRMAEEAGLDLVEIQADVRPPLCKIMDYGKYKYEQSKKQKGNTSKGQELKEVRLGRSSKIDDHDVEIRVKQARRFLMEGNKVLLRQRFRGREVAHKEIGVDRIKGICEELSDIAKVESPPKHAGRDITVILAPDKGKVDAAKRRIAKEQPKAQPPEQKPADAPKPEATPQPEAKPTEQPSESVS
ncbi:MAG: translation initiation factor IF-3 [Phycisphaeraceae bacterium]|nr:MAG: translation initiation factor IF-3 [Phycisphaeraceae bacterium]